jgi:hypothetical protein
LAANILESVKMQRDLTFRMLAIVVAMSTGPAALGQVRTVALANLPAPGAPSGALIAGFSKSVLGAQVPLNNSARSAFLGDMIGGFGGVTTATNTGVWSAGGGTLALLAREGSQAAGATAGALFEQLAADPILNDRGQVAFPALLREGGGAVTTSNNAGIWSQRNGVLGLVARSGSSAPGTPAGANFKQFYANTYGDGMLAFNNANQTAFNAALTVGAGGVTADNDTGIWTEGGGTLALAAREGLQAPGAPAGAVFDDLSSSSESPVLNNLGQLAFTAQLRIGAGGVVSGDDYGIWTGTGAGLNLVAREGGASPVPAGGSFRHFGEVQINDAGSLLFRGLLYHAGDPANVGSNNDEALWMYRNGAVEAFAREGSQVPGMPAAANYGSFSSYTINNAGKAAANGYLQQGSGGVTGEDNAAVWAGATGDFRLVAREGQLAPGTERAAFSDFLAVSSNAAGQVAFTATLKAGIGEVTPSNDFGIWATDYAGAVHLIAREGDPLEVAPGDVRTITRLDFRGNTGNADGRRSMFNDKGELQFWAQLGTGEGVFISEAVKLPPPPGDFDGNGQVNATDLSRWKTGFGTSDIATYLVGDADGDKDVDGSDFLAWQQQLGTNIAGELTSVTPTPEPESLLMALAGGLAMFARRRLSPRQPAEFADQPQAKLGERFIARR